MQDVGWGAVNQALLDRAERLISRTRTSASLLIREAYLMSTSPSPGRVSELLNRAGVDFVIIGAHALGVFTKDPRATQDVDVVVADMDRAVAAVRPIARRSRVLDLGPEVGKRIADARGNQMIDLLYENGGVRG